ncbi:ABC transporter substrate-binding protein [Pseudonocardia sp. 73-21]|uniref:ABC transporter substrate-binding protein n=1 Tax=Pseudonocardia sp. 73-21 TaxID=1895809 RepID=UPI00095CFDD4|nr:ABC transporter substrate-binding protein [Pseudonocardia sp. 73-21]OJY39817.1 MAG: ABC transporter substrate-binding protein [Pseudonocardia sp. 73-21]
MRRTMIGMAVVAAAAMVLTACGSGSGTASGGSGSDIAKATSVTEAGGMDALVAAAKKEGTLNTITLPANWANYGTIIKTFEAKYGITIDNANPDGSSQDEINAVKQLRGQDRAPDVLDLGQSFAIQASKDGLLAPYKVASFDKIPAAAKDAGGTWTSDYGGYVSIGYDPAKVPNPPTSFADLLKPEYKNMVAINGNPTQAGAAFAAVYAAALANGGSFDDIAPGVDFFKKLKAAGNFVPVTGSPATVQSGQTPILIWWDYLQESSVASQLPSWKVVIPSDASYAAYYSQAINATAPHPAAARLWEEFLYSVEGQNLWLNGSARPILLPDLVKDGTVDAAANAKLPPAPAGEVKYPTDAQQAAAKTIVSQQWAAAVGG